MKSPLLGWLTFALIGVSDCAMAQTLVGTTTDPKGIDGLVVDGTTYNVTFSTSTFYSPFTQESAASLDAAAAMTAALDSLGVTELAGVPPAQCGPHMRECVLRSMLFVAVDNAPVGLNDTAQADCAPFAAPLPCSPFWRVGEVKITPDGSGPILGLGPLSFAGTVYGYGYAADFTAPGVPEPGTLSLLAIALAGLGVVGRRTRAARLIAFSSMPASVLQPAAGLITEFPAGSLRNAPCSYRRKRLHRRGIRRAAKDCYWWITWVLATTVSLHSLARRPNSKYRG